MDIKFHYICETVLPGKITLYLPSLHALVSILSHTFVYCSKPVQALLSLLLRVFLLPSLSLSITPGLKPYLSLFYYCSPGACLFTALSFSSLGVFLIVSTGVYFHVVHVLARSLRLWLLLSGCFFFVFIMRMLTIINTC